MISMYNEAAESTALSKVRGIWLARAQSKPIYPQKISATIQSIILEETPKKNPITNSTMMTPIKEKNKVRPSDKKNFG